MFSLKNVQDNKICIIVFCNNMDKKDRIKSLFENQRIPDGMQLDVLEVINENGMAAAYNEAMEASNAKYKIYLKADTILLYENIVEEVVNVFKNNHDIGIIGAYGCPQIPTSGCWGDAGRKAGKYYSKNGKRVVGNVRISEEYLDVMAVSSMFLATQYDIVWREDLFSGEEYISASQCVEFKRKGYRAVVLQQKKPYISGTCENKGNEIENRQFLKEYYKDVLPLVSVGIPTYDRPKLLEKTIRSAMNQTYQNLEIVVSDNGPNKETRRVVEKCIKEDARIRYYHTDVVGENANWRNVFKYFSPEAEYIQTLCDDDLLVDCKIEKMLQCYFDHDNVSLVTSFRKLIDENDAPITMPRWKPVVQEDSVVSGKEVGRFLLNTGENFIGEPTTPLLRRELLVNDCLGFSGKERWGMTDYPTWLRMMECGDLFYIVEPLSCFRQHGGQGQRGNSARKSIHPYLTFAETFQYVVENDIFQLGDEEIYQIVEKWLKNAPDVDSLEESQYDFDRERLQDYIKYYYYMERLLDEYRCK